MKAYGISNSPLRTGVNERSGKYAEINPGPFSLVTGVAGLVTVSGNVIQCAAHNGIVSRYQKLIDANAGAAAIGRTRMSNFQLDFQVTVNNPDDAAEIRLLDAFTFQPRREAAFDANRRAVIGFNAVLTTVGTTGVAIGTWYRLILNIVPATGVLNWRIQERDTEVLFQQGVSAAAPLAAVNFNRIDINFDSSGLTCPVNYARLLCG